MTLTLPCVQHKETAPNPGVWPLVMTILTFLVICGPFCCFKLLLDESYEVVSDRDKNILQMRIRRDKLERKKEKMNRKT